MIMIHGMNVNLINLCKNIKRKSIKNQLILMEIVVSVVSKVVVQLCECKKKLNKNITSSTFYKIFFINVQQFSFCRA